DRAVPGIVELLLFNRTGDAAADRHPFQDLAIGHLVGADDPEPASSQFLSVGIAPEHLLGPLLEASVESAGPPVAGPMRLKVDVIEDAPDRSSADRGDDPVGDRLACQVLAGPV